MSVTAFFAGLEIHFQKVCEISSAFGRELGMQEAGRDFQFFRVTDCIEKIMELSMKLGSPLRDISSGRLKIDFEKLSRLDSLYERIDAENRDIKVIVHAFERELSYRVSSEIQGYIVELQKHENALRGVIGRISCANEEQLLPIDFFNDSSLS